MDNEKNLNQNDENVEVTEINAEEVAAEEVAADDNISDADDNISNTDVYENVETVSEDAFAALNAPEKTGKTKHKINKNKIKFGSLATISTVIFLAVVIAFNIAINLAAQRFNMKIDLTAENVFTLDKETLDFLDEMKGEAEIIILGNEYDYREAASSLSDTYYRSGAIAPEVYVVKTLDNYTRNSDKITIHYVDPRYNPNFFKERGITLDDGTDTAKNIFCVVYSPETRRYRFVKDTIFQDLQYVGFERRVTAGLLYVTVENIQTIAIVKGHGEANLPYFQEIMKDNGFDVKYITIQEFDEIPDFVSILVINDPLRDYSVDDINKIDAWLSNNELLGRHLMVFTDVDMVYNKYLEEYLEEWGIVLGEESIFDTQNSYTFTNAVYPILKVKYSDVSATLAEDLAKGGYNQYIQLGNARAVSAVFESKDSYHTYPIITTYDTAFSRKTANTVLQPTDWKGITKNEDDTVGPFAVSYLSRKVRYEGMTEFSSSVYVCGSTSFVDDYFMSNIDGQNQQTAEYMIKLCKYLVASKQSYDTGILPTQLIFSTLSFETTGQVVATFLGIVIGIPAILIVVGIVVWRRRKFL